MKPGDTLWNIAKKFYTTVEEIIQMNNLDRDEVSSGTPLLLVKKSKNNIEFSMKIG